MTNIAEYEAQFRLDEEADRLLEFARITVRQHGIADHCIWIGTAAPPNGLRIRISNVPNRCLRENSFSVILPELEYDPAQVADWVDLPRVFAWIRLNQELLLRVGNNEFADTGDFLSQIRPV